MIAILNSTNIVKLAHWNELLSAFLEMVLPVCALFQDCNVINLVC